MFNLFLVIVAIVIFVWLWISYFRNFMKVVKNDFHKNLTGMVVLRICGIFFVPLGMFLGFFKDE